MNKSDEESKRKYRAEYYLRYYHEHKHDPKYIARRKKTQKKYYNMKFKVRKVKRKDERIRKWSLPAITADCDIEKTLNILLDLCAHPEVTDGHMQAAVRAMFREDEIPTVNRILVERVRRGKIGYGTQDFTPGEYKFMP